MPDLRTAPLWRPEDLGRPIPDSPHAVSACLPTWRDNVAYEENDPRVHDKLRTGYPRFVYNEFCRRLFAERGRSRPDDETCIACPSARVAERLARFIERRCRRSGRIHADAVGGVYVVSIPKDAAAAAKAWWQHCGEGISSRQAEAVLTGAAAPDAGAAKQTLRRRLAALYGVDDFAVWLFPTGMNAQFTVHRALLKLFPDRRSVQFGFPYVDTLKVQQLFGPGVHFFPRGDEAELRKLAEVVRSERLSGIFTEFPTNPLLLSPDLVRLQQLAHSAGGPLVVDDTIAGPLNVNVLPTADVVWSSLTKFFSGVGDVTGGAAIVNPDSPFAALIANALREEWEDLLWPGDAVVLEHNSRRYPQRMETVNRNAEQLAGALHRHTNVARVYYPKYAAHDQYTALRRAGGGYSGLLSIDLHDAPRTASRFFDALRVSKGPNLGMEYTLACPFTILAHYNELTFAESCGVSRYLIRVSVGTEDPHDLIARFDEALTEGGRGS
jgi:cystathionine gamma-synthase